MYLSYRVRTTTIWIFSIEQAAWMSECVLLSLRSLDVHVVMVSPAHRDHDHHQAMVNHFVDQAVAHIMQFDFVGVVQFTTQLG